MPDMQAIDIWQKVLVKIQPKITEFVFGSWIKALIPLKIEENFFIIGAPKNFVKEWVEENYTPLISSIINEIVSVPLKLVIKNLDIDEEISPQDQSSRIDSVAVEIKTTPQPFNPEELALTLNQKYTFENFVIGNSNRFAHAASLAVSETPAKVYNPLFLYGGVGLGKTHLMHAIGQKIRENNPHSKILYISTEKFTNELINSIRDGNPEKFRQKYRGIDCLLIDDIQFLAKKEHTQEEFFHTFNTLYDSNKQIVISSDRTPKEIPTLEDRLRSRFEWGLITDIQPPDIETRIAILRKKAMLDNLEIPNEVIFFIASKIENNIRELEGAFLRVIAFSSLNKTPITMENTIQALKEIVNTSFKKPVTIEKIQEVVASHYKIKKEDLIAKKRTRNIVYPRQISMYLCRKLTDYSLPKIGELFGGRDHTTVIHAIDKITKSINEDIEVEKQINYLSQKLQS